jgi:hypothetical protein
MIRRRIGNILLLEDVVDSVNMMTKDRAVMKLQNEKAIFEFRNTEKPFADIVKKQKFENGEHILLVGAQDRTSSMRFYGFQAERTGMVASKNSSLYKGQVIEINQSDISSSIIIQYGDPAKEETIIVPSYKLEKLGLVNGDFVVCFCTSYIKKTCVSCSNKKWNDKICKTCTKANLQKERVLMALEVEKIERN